LGIWKNSEANKLHVLGIWKHLDSKNLWYFKNFKELLGFVTESTNNKQFYRWLFDFFKKNLELWLYTISRYLIFLITMFIYQNWVFNFLIFVVINFDTHLHIQWGFDAISNTHPHTNFDKQWHLHGRKEKKLKVRIGIKSISNVYWNITQTKYWVLQFEKRYKIYYIAYIMYLHKNIDNIFEFELWN